MKIIKDKRGLEFKSAFFALVALSMVIIAAGAWVTEWNTDYDAGLSYDLDADYNKLDDLSSEADDQQGKMTIESSTSSTSGDLRFEDTTLRGVFGILNNIYAPFRIVFGDNGMIDSVTERFGAPDYVRQGLVTMMVMAVTFALAAIFFRLPRRSV